MRLKHFLRVIDNTNMCQFQETPLGTFEIFEQSDIRLTRKKQTMQSLRALEINANKISQL